MRVTDLSRPWSTAPYLLGEHAQADVLAVRSTDDALVAVVAGPGRDTGLFGLGDPRTVGRLTTELVRAGEPALDLARFATLERGALDATEPAVLAALRLAGAGSQWDWMWTPHTLTGDPTGAERLPPGPATVAEVAECLARAHPAASTPPDDERLIGWWGVRQEGRLMAIIGAVLLTAGLPPHLVSLGVDPSTRGQGLAGVVMSAAVRDCLEVVPEVGDPMVSLGLYASNDVARRVYTRAGFRLEHRFESRRPAA